MLFSEIYGSYFNTVASVLSRAVTGSLTKKELTEIVRKAAFEESSLTIPAALADESWPLLEADMHTPLLHKPTMPLSRMQKQWLKALLQDQFLQEEYSVHQLRMNQILMVKEKYQDH